MKTKYNGKYKKMTIYILSLCQVLLLGLLTHLLNGHIKANVPFCILGIALMILAVPLHIFAKKCKSLYGGSILLNTAGSAVFTSMYYTATEKPTSAKTLLLGSLCALSILTITYIALHIIPKFSAYASIGGILAALGSAVFNIVQWIRAGTVPYSFGFFSTVVALMYLFAMLRISETDKSCAARYASFSSFGIFTVICIVVLTILSEGEILEGFEIGDLFSSGESKKSKKHGIK